MFFQKIWLFSLRIWLIYIISSPEEVHQIYSILHIQLSFARIKLSFSLVLKRMQLTIPFCFQKRMKKLSESFHFQSFWNFFKVWLMTISSLAGVNVDYKSNSTLVSLADCQTLKRPLNIWVFSQQVIHPIWRKSIRTLRSEKVLTFLQVWIIPIQVYQCRIPLYYLFLFCRPGQKFFLGLGTADMKHDNLVNLWICSHPKKEGSSVLSKLISKNVALERKQNAVSLRILFPFTISCALFSVTKIRTVGC